MILYHNLLPVLEHSSSPCKNCQPGLQVTGRSGSAVQIPPETDRTATALCQSGEISTGGGYSEDGPMLVFVFIR